MNPRRLGGVAAAAVLLALLAPITRASAGPAPLIQPGEYVESDAGGCTLNFIFDGGGTFVGTAAHCVPDGVGADVSLSDGTVFGDVAAIGDPDATETDWALIRVRSAYLNRVSAAVKGHPGFPRGVTTPAETTFLDKVQQSGYGVGFNFVEATRKKRVAVLTYDDAELFTVIGAAIYGDSGGPLVHKPTGKALGIVSRLCVGTCEMEGPTVQGIRAKAAAKGFNVNLRTV